MTRRSVRFHRSTSFLLLYFRLSVIDEELFSKSLDRQIFVQHLQVNHDAFLVLQENQVESEETISEPNLVILKSEIDEYLKQTPKIPQYINKLQLSYSEESIFSEEEEKSEVFMGKQRDQAQQMIS